MTKIDWVKHWNTKIEKLDPNNLWFVDMTKEGYKEGYEVGYQHGKEHCEEKAIRRFNSTIDSVISDLRDLQY